MGVAIPSGEAIAVELTGRTDVVVAANCKDGLIDEGPAGLGLGGRRMSGCDCEGRLLALLEIVSFLIGVAIARGEGLSSGLGLEAVAKS